jgi:hypothetical protein
VAQVRQATLSDALRAGGELNGKARNGGHWDGAAPPDDAIGIHGQLCCGENETVIVQLCCEASVKDDPGDVVQESCSLKCGIPSKSLGVLLEPGKVI